MKDFISWLITSSADPQKTSLALKGLLTFGSGYVLNILTALCGFGFVCLGIDATWLSTAIDIVTQLALGALYIIGAVVAGWGAWRKIRLGRFSAYRSSPPNLPR